MAFTGDIMFGRYIEGGFRPIRAEDDDPFDRVAALLDSDLTLANLETPVMTAPPAVSKWGTAMRFVTTPARIARLAPAGIDVVTLANNHYYDMRAKGVAETPVLLRAAGVQVVGAARTDAPLFRVETIEPRGWRVGIVAAAAVNNTSKPPPEKLPYVHTGKLGAALVPVIEAARADHDVVIVAVHWGKEYSDAPSRTMVKAAHQWIDAGANAVIGHHPHRLHGIERYHGGVIAYSLGNFLFDNAHRDKRDAGILRLTFSAECTVEARFHPTVIEEGGPGFEATVADTRAEHERIAKRLVSLSAAKPLRTRWRRDGDVLVSDPASSSASPAACGR
jgi:poly-gamma-glutamate capsule biosynthesis protein CapA/YwtB (metallophosphatase superfamily)